MAKQKTWEEKMVQWIRMKRPTIYCVCRHVSSSGMFRRISFYAIRRNELVYLDGLIEDLADYKRDKKEQGLRVTGCGMDMGFAVVYAFSHAIFAKGFRYRKGECHRNGDPSPIDKDGGYALKHQWI